MNKGDGQAALITLAIVACAFFVIWVLVEGAIWRDEEDLARLAVPSQEPKLDGSMDFTQRGHSYTMFYGIDCRGEAFTTVTHHPGCPCRKEKQ